MRRLCICAYMQEQARQKGRERDGLLFWQPFLINNVTQLAGRHEFCVKFANVWLLSSACVAIACSMCVYVQQVVGCCCPSVAPFWWTVLQQS